MRHGASSILLLATLPLWSCGEDDGASIPSQPIAPGPGANVVAVSGVSIGLCSSAGCAYSLVYRNDGGGCGNTLRGKVRAYRDDTLLETDDWFLDSTRTVVPGETIAIEDCCFDADTVENKTRFTAEAFWNNVSCG